MRASGTMATPTGRIPRSACGSTTGMSTRRRRPVSAIAVRQRTCRHRAASNALSASSQPAPVPPPFRGRTVPRCMSSIVARENVIGTAAAIRYTAIGDMASKQHHIVAALRRRPP